MSVAISAPVVGITGFWCLLLALKALTHIVGWAADRRRQGHGLCLFRAVLDWFGRARTEGATGGDPELEEQFRETLSEKRVQLARGLMPCFCALATYRAVEKAMHALLHEGHLMDASFLLVYSGCALCTLCPRLVCGRTLVAWHCYFMATWHVDASPLLLELDSKFVLFQTTTLAATIGIGFLCLQFPVMLATNVVGMIVSLASIQAKWHPAVGLSFKDFASLEFTCFLLKIAIFRFTTIVVERSVRREVETRIGACHRSAVTSLLGMMCDAVVDLDQQLALKQHVGKLASMLMHGTGKSLQGCALSDFMGGDEDRERFKEVVSGYSANSSAGLSPSMLSIYMRDAIGNSIKTILYHVPYRSIAGRVHHLVGLREDTDHKDEQFGDVTRASSDAIGRALVGRAEMPAAVLTEDVQRRLGCQSDGSQLGTPSDGSGAPVGGLGSGGSFASGDAEGDVVAEVWATEELRIRWGSTPFQLLVGLQTVRGVSFRELLQDEGVAQELAEWVLDHASKVSAGTAQAFIGSFGELTFGSFGGSSTWSVEVCFPWPHPEFQQRRRYLVGIRLKPMAQATQQRQPQLHQQELQERQQNLLDRRPQEGQSRGATIHRSISLATL